MNNALNGGDQVAGICKPCVRIVGVSGLFVRCDVVAIHEPAQRSAAVHLVFVRLGGNAVQADVLVDDER